MASGVKNFITAGCVVALSFSGWFAGWSDSGQPPDVKLASIKVPPGFVVERVAGPPLVGHPLMGCFDERGRLFVAEAAGVNLPFEELARNPPNFIRLLEDTKGDGRFDKSRIFADKMTFPMGVLWHEGGLYTMSAPSLWRLEDSKDAGVADNRKALISKFSSVGNGADIHGPFLGPDGRLYWTKGRHPHEIRQPDGAILKGLGARIFRCKPDGGELEVVCGGGMDDPVEIIFTPEGEPLATVDILIGTPQRHDAIIYCVEGGVYPYAANVLAEFKRTGDLLPPVTDLGWVAPSGLARYRSGAFGPEYRNNLFSAQFNRRRIQRHILERDGATFRTREEDFLISTDPDFHPTDMLEDADGSLLVIDTGGWFRIGCPASQIAKPQIKGGIYRVRREDQPKVADPRGLTLNWNRLGIQELVALLDDPRFAVRDRAVEQLAKQKEIAVTVLKDVMTKNSSIEARRNAVWTACRLTDAEARSIARLALRDKDASVRLSAAHAAGLHRDAQALPPLLKMLVKEEAAIRREAATALGRIRNKAAVSTLFKSLRTGGDRFLEHALIYALIEIADRDATIKGLRDPSPEVRRAALIALDQMAGGNLTRDLVTPLLNTDDPALQKTTLEIISARPGWAKEVTGLLRDWLSQPSLAENRRESLQGALLAFCKDTGTQELVAQYLKEEKTPVAIRLLLLEAMARAPLDKLPASWAAGLAMNLGHSDVNVMRQTLTTIRASGVSNFDQRLLMLAGEPTRPADIRLSALAAIVRRLPALNADSFDFLKTCLEKDQPPLLRLQAADALGNARLDDNQLQDLAKLVEEAGALELPHLLAAYERSKNLQVGNQLVVSLEKSPGLESLSADVLRKTLQAYPVETRKLAEPLLKRLEIDRAKQSARLAELEPLLKGGQPLRGRQVFFGKKASCTACHAVQGEGGRIGPDLTKIGSIRTGRDLLEAVVFPSASFVRGYEPYVVATRDGRLHTGILARETSESVYLITAERAEIPLPRSAIESIETGRVSIMPQGLDAQLTRQELADLIAFLQSLR